MRQGWRWFGPEAPVTLDDVRQTGATNIVSSLHQVPIGRAWTEKEVRERQSLIETTPGDRSPLTWSVVESIPIPDAVKRKGGRRRPKSRRGSPVSKRSPPAAFRSSAIISCLSWTGPAPTSIT